MEKLAEYGVAALAIGAVMASIQLVRFVVEKRTQNGNGKMECPVNVKETLLLIKQIDSSVRRTERSAKAAEEGIKALLVDHMDEMVQLQKRSAIALEQLVALPST